IAPTFVRPSTRKCRDTSWFGTPARDLARPATRGAGADKDNRGSGKILPNDNNMGLKVTTLLRREFRFLHQPLNLGSRLLLVMAAITIAISLFFPLWKMHLVAPQYSDGLDLYIYAYKIEGGGFNGQHLAEINGLNHYIGMKPIQQVDFTEMQLMPFVFGIIILLILRSIVFGEMANVV